MNDKLKADGSVEKNDEIAAPVERLVSCVKATKLKKGCVVKMKASSGMTGYGNAQCISSVCEPLGEISLYGHNQHYKDYDVEKVIEYPFIEYGFDS
jgi:hypothetical protein